MYVFCEMCEIDKILPWDELIEERLSGRQILI